MPSRANRSQTQHSCQQRHYLSSCHAATQGMPAPPRSANHYLGLFTSQRVATVAINCLHLKKHDYPFAVRLANRDYSSTAHMPRLALLSRRGSGVRVLLHLARVLLHPKATARCTARVASRRHPTRLMSPTIDSMNRSRAWLPLHALRASIYGPMCYLLSSPPRLANSAAH